MSKYHNHPTTIDGQRFASKAEANQYAILLLQQRNGQIKDLRCQVSYVLQPAFKDAAGKKQRAICYVGDFEFTETDSGKRVCLEVKGAETAVWKMKQKLFLFKYPDVELRVVKA